MKRKRAKGIFENAIFARFDFPFIVNSDSTFLLKKNSLWATV